MDAAVGEGAQRLELERVLDYPTTPVASEDVRVLISTVEELLQRIVAPTDSELGRLRASTDSALAAARATMPANAVGVRETGEPASRAGVSPDGYLGKRPLVTLGVTALIAFAMGLCVGRSTVR